MLRIIWLLLDSRSVGGLESHILQLAIALKKQGFAVRVVFYCHYGEHPLYNNLRQHHIAMTVLDGKVLSLFHAIRHSRPNLLHTHGYKAGILGRLIARIFKVPVVSTFHSGEPGEGKVRLYNFLDRLTAPLAQGIIAVSEPIAKQLPRKTQVINNFVLVGQESIQRGQIVAFVGRLNYEKGPDLFCQLAQWIPNIQLEIFGDGPMLSDLQKKYPQVTFHGLQTDMEACWAKIGLLCMSSRHEGLPMVAIEAMAQGIPVAAFAVGGLPKVIQSEQNGWLVPAGDIQKLAQTVQTWLSMDDAGRQKMAKIARRTVLDGFSPEVILPQILKIYSQ